ncbi:hypothetical protein WH91_04460 [Devosia psychrophila]|uniref:Ca2+-binding protein, RTX toxin-related n=1 Tax=Devosia psychrophila TaxID=728005 RepID=A0ABR5E1P3_9HYPH|nr:hypothetical protein WH91_04460 [Devosia psychrophila]
MLAARDAAAISIANTATHTAYVNAEAAAGQVQTTLGSLLAELATFRTGMNDNILDADDATAVNNAAQAAHAASLAQDAVVASLQSNSGVSAAVVSEAQTVQASLASLDSILSGYALLTAGSFSFAQFNDLVNAQTLATGISTDATANLLALSQAETGTSQAGAATALTELIEANGLEISSDGSILIEHRSADIGLSPPNSVWMAFFGQFFDHGLDLVTKGGNGTIYIPLQADDPLIAGADHILGGAGAADDLPAHLRFMALSRTTGFNADGTPSPTGTESQNTTTPFIDQNQTYTSSASHQAFLREYRLTVDSPAAGTALDSYAVNTGRMLNGANGGVANWAEVKDQAKEKLGLTMDDRDVLDVPQLVVDAYGKIILGANGFAQVMVTVIEVVAGVTFTTLLTVEGKAHGLDLHNITLADLPASFVAHPGGTFVVHTVGTGHAFLNDIANTAGPVVIGGALAADADNINGNAVPNDGQGHNTQYDNELLDKHFITGDGRGNENIGLTAVHTIFHSEHNRLVEANKDTIIASGNLATINEWLAPGAGGVRQELDQAELDGLNALSGQARATAIDALNWDGERLFQAARFVTEMQYQHLVFEEFARRIQPNVDPFVFTNSADLNPAIVAEFAHTVYRFGHSMLTDTVDRFDSDLSLVNSNVPGADDPLQLTLIQAFLNPDEFSKSGVNDEAATGSIIRGMSREVGAEIDEFVVEALRNNLLGLPLDLPALNIARGRETGIPSLNDSRAQIYAMTGAVDVKPYTSWTDFAQHLKHPLSVINFIAAYGTHEAITSALTLEGKRSAATLLVLGDGNNADGVTINGVTYSNDERLAFLNGSDLYATGGSDPAAIARLAAAAIGSLGGLNTVDLWIGGLAEELNEFGGQLGSTFNYIFEYQMEHLQNSDRFYYLSRTQGMNLLNLLEPNTFTDLVMRNTDLGEIHSTHLPANLMSVADMILELDNIPGQENYSGVAARDGTNPDDRSLLDPVWEDAFLQSIDPKVLRLQGTLRVGQVDADGKPIYDGGVLKFSGGEHVVLGGTEGNDTLIGDKGIDALWGDGGNDYLNAGMESDHVYGGEGDDIIEDPFGDDFLRGEAGDDVIVADTGLDLLFGGEGQDFIMGVTDFKEVFAGPGNDFVLGGTAPDGLLGNEGDDWLEGGEGFDSLSGENSELFFDSPIIGHDILNGQGNDTDYDGESGDDIMVQGAGIQRNNGMLGFDWAIQKGDPNNGVIDLGISRFLTQTALTLRDRNDSVEAASGWKHNDTLIGTSAPVGAVGVQTGPIGGPLTDSFLLSQNVALIRNFEDFLKLAPGAVIGQSAATVAAMAVRNAHFSSLTPDTTVFDPTGGGDILLGGAGSDTITGNAGNDLIDGDRWLNVRIAMHDTKDLSSIPVTSVDGLTSIVTGSGHADWDGKTLADLMRTGKINPGQLEAVRELITDGVLASDVDVAVYHGNRADFSIVVNANGTVTVTDNVVAPIFDVDGVTRIPLLDDEGVDTLVNMERIRFADGEIAINKPPTGAPVISDLTPTEGQQLSLNTASIADLNGLGAFSYQWQSSANGTTWTNIAGATNSTFTPQDINLLGFNGLDAQAGLMLRARVSFTDGDGNTEQLFSAPTGPTGANWASPIAATFNGTAGDDIANGSNGLTFNNVFIAGGADTLIGNAGDDLLIGNNGIDLLNGGTGNDTLNGGNQTDTVTYANASGSVSVSLVTNSATGADGIDTLIGIENITGGGFNDTLTGNGQANVLTGAGGNDSVTGGAGTDTAVFAGNASNSSFALSGANIVVTDLTGAEGTDTLDSIETLSFAGANYTVVQGSAAADANLNGAAGSQAIFGWAGNDSLSGGAGSDILMGGADNDTINGGTNNDLILWRAGDGRDFIDGGANVDTLHVNGDASAETFAIYAVTPANVAIRTALQTSLGTTFNANTEIVITRTSGTVTTVIAELDNIEEISINNLNVTANDGGGLNTAGSGDTITVSGDFTTTSLNFSTITVNGTAGNDTVNIASLTSAHRIVFHSNGGNDTVVGNLRPQDVIDLAPGSSLASYHSTVDGNGTTTFSNGTHSITFASTGTPQFVESGPSNGGNAVTGAFDYSASDLSGLKALINGQQPAGGDDGLTTGVRNLSGHGNNIANPTWGSADEPFTRITSAHYGAPDANGNLAINPIFAGLDPRNISNILGTQEADLPHANNDANIFFMAMGQYIDHGMDFLGKGGNGTVQIGDAGGSSSTNPADLSRGTVAGYDANGVPLHINHTSPFIDQNQAYGSNALVGALLREGDGQGGLTSHLLQGSVDPSNANFKLLPTLRELIEHHWANNTEFAMPDGSLVAFQAYFAGLVNSSGVINPAMLPAMTSNFMGSGHSLLLDTNPYINVLDHYVAGDGRANENYALTSIHTIWARNHNFHVDALEAAGFQGTAEELFQAAKIVNEAEYQRVVFNEYADVLLGGLRGGVDSTHGFDGYDPTLNPGISQEFAASVFRFGHSLIGQTMTILDADGNPTQVSLFDAFLNPSNDADAFTLPMAQLNAYGYFPQPGYEQFGVGSIIGGIVTQPAEEVDFNLVDAIRNDLVRINADLFAFNEARGWDLGLGTLNQVRRDLANSNDPHVQESASYAGDLSPYVSWEDFQARNGLSATVINQFRQAFPDLLVAAADVVAFAAINPGILVMQADGSGIVKGIDRVDLWLGGLAEQHINGGVVGQTFWVVLQDQFDRLQDGDRFYYLDRVEGFDFYQNFVDGEGFSDIIARNTGLTNLPEHIFQTDELNDGADGDDGEDGDGTPIGDDEDNDDGDDTDGDGDDQDDGDQDDGDNGDGDGDADNDDDGDDDDGEPIVPGGDGCDDDDDDDAGSGSNNPLPVGGSLVGTLASDVLMGTAGADLIFGMAGTDHIVAGAGVDVITADAGDDFVGAGAGRDIVFGGTGNDDVLGGADADLIYGEDGNDRIFGDDGNDMLDGGNGNDTVFGGTGNDMFIGHIGDGNDTYDGGEGIDTLDFGSLTAAVTVDFGTGVGGRGSVVGAQSGTDTLYSVENITTGSGNDRIVASLAVNVMDGGDGNDVFVFGSVAAANGDTILGFEAGDKIDLSGIDANADVAGVQRFSLIGGQAATAPAQLVITHESRGDGDFTIVSGNVNAGNAGDFHIELAGNHTLTNQDFNL